MSIELELVAAIASAVATVIGAAGSSWGYKSGSTEVTDKALSHIDKRLKELKDYLARQEAMEKRNRFSGGFLTIGQYIVGGVLATSFIQETLSNQITGFLGVLVLVASIIHQRFRPDLKVASARNRVTRLKKILRSANDQVNRIGIEHMAGSPELLLAENKIASLISAQISEVEESEQQDVNGFEAIQYKDDKK
jgi:hypothetical protein